MTQSTKLADHFGIELAQYLATTINDVHPSFDSKSFVKYVRSSYEPLALKARVELIADGLRQYLPNSYKKSIKILTSIMGEENPKETGMFKEFYWLMPIGKYIEKYGLEDLEISLNAIEELTKRNTGEYCIRPYIKKYSKETMSRMKQWAKSDNFHLRRLASEGCRPKLPWAAKLDLYIENPRPVFTILNILKREEVMFVKKSVANNLADYFKVNPQAAYGLVEKWENVDDPNTRWIIKHSMRKVK